MSVKLYTLAERPELEAAIPGLHSASWPPFILADPTAERLWGSLFSLFAEYQYVLCNEQGQLIAAGHALPLAWNGTVDALPSGFDGALEQGFQESDQGRIPTTLCGLSIVIAPGQQGHGLSEMLARSMKDLAAAAGLRYLIIPIRPTLKSRYPLVPMDHYIQWKQPDGSLFDPWLRIHQRLGAEILAIAPRSMAIQGTVAQWEEWTAMRFPESGAYPVPGALVPIEIDSVADRGSYREPNVWIRYHIEP